MLKRYIEFICLRVKNSTVLLDTLNRLEIALAKPLTQEGQHIESLLDCITPDFSLPQTQVLKNRNMFTAYTSCPLSQMLKQEESELDLQAMKLVGTYLAGLAEQTPSKQYWNLVYVALNQIEQLLINEPRLRVL